MLSVLFGNRKVFSDRATCSGLSDTVLMYGGSLFHWFGRPGHRKTALTETVGVGVQHDQVDMVSRVKSQSMQWLQQN